MKQLAFAIATGATLCTGSAVAQSADIGQELYSQYCATCHGSDGSGAGPLTEIMLEKPSDLTTLSAMNPSNKGEFPMLKVLHIIDGRTGLRGHGGPMPTYGAIFQSDMAEQMGDLGAVIETRGRILSLALYLESIQQ